MEKHQPIDYLRLSLTDRCNLNCIYCNPLKKEKFVPRDELLQYGEIVRIVKHFVKAGIRKLRLTGGEPLLKKDLLDLIGRLHDIEELKEISMTTNGVSLNKLAHPLKNNGLDRINISLDTLNREKFKKITGFDQFDNVWQGILKSLQVGFNPVKINVILMRGVNDDEIIDFAKLTRKYPLIIRFIELFQTNSRMQDSMVYEMKSPEAKQLITDKYGELKLNTDILGHGPAKNFKFNDAPGSIGFINNLSDYFCHGCNRIRIDCSGRIAPCLFSGNIFDIKPLLRNLYPDHKIDKFVQDIIKNKPTFQKNNGIRRNIEMSSIGG